MYLYREFLANVDSFSIITPSSKLEQCKYDVLAAIRRNDGIDAEIDQGISMIAIVGGQVAYKTEFRNIRSARC